MNLQVVDTETGDAQDLDEFLADAEAEGQEGNYDEEVESIIEELTTPVIIEAILDGPLSDYVSDEEFAEAQEIGLSLGIVVNTAEGLALAKDCVDRNGLALGASTIGFMPSGIKAGMGARIGRSVAKLKGKVDVIKRGVQAVGGSSSRFLSANKKSVAVAGGALAGGAALKAAMRSRGGNQNPSQSALVKNAEARTKSAKS